LRFELKWIGPICRRSKRTHPTAAALRLASEIEDRIVESQPVEPKRADCLSPSAPRMAMTARPLGHSPYYYIYQAQLLSRAHAFAIVRQAPTARSFRC